MRVVEVYKPCEYCKGRGLEWDGKYSTDCRVCQGHGKVIETVRKEPINAPMETKRRRTEQNR